MKTNLINILFLSCSIMLFSCKKDWLEQKRDIKLIVPTTLADLRLLLNNNAVFAGDYAGITEVSAGDYYINTGNWKALDYYPEQKAYNWQNPFKGQAKVIEWDGAYAQIAACNVILEAIGKIPVNNINVEEWRDIKGAALFYRARAFFNLAQVFVPPYVSANFAKPAIPLRTSSDVNTEIKRNTVKETYDLLIRDLKDSAPLLRTVPANKMNASKPAAYAQLSRCFLSMGDYENAKLYADSCLSLYNKLMDYSTLDQSATFPFAMFNDEVILHSGLLGNYGSFFSPTGIIQPEISISYDANDLRKQLFFVLNPDFSYSMKGFYFGFRTAFGGLATDEILLIRSECLARANQVSAAMTDLNMLLIKRFKKNLFTPLTATTANEALSIILRERRKELLLRGVRWSDLRRLNTDPQYVTTITRTLDNQIYQLKPDDDRYTFPLPDYVIRDYKLQQNPGW